jgi:hypothetical protein
MKRTILTLLALLPLLAFGQVKYLIFGVVDGNVPVSSTINGSDNIYLNDKTLVIVSSLIKDSDGGIFEIYYKNKKLYINTDFLKISKEDQKSFDKGEASELDSIKSKAFYAAEVIYKNDLKKAIAFLDNTKTKGLAVLNWNYYDESEYTNGTSTKIEVYNPMKKTIKYIWFSFVGYNAVGDIVSSKGQTIRTVKAIGPIKEKETGSYEFPYVWLTDIVQTAKLKSIKIQYMDGTFKLVPLPSAIILPKNLYDILHDDVEED